MPEAQLLALATRGSGIAAAGCGKTELIAKATASVAGRQLILTHTNAGVEAIRRRLRRLGVAGNQISVDTIDGWCLKFVGSYPVLSGGVPTNEDGFCDWRRLRVAMICLLEKPIIRRVIQASYDGVYVDEYQDCVPEQHFVVTALADLVPTRVLGDPLQSVFRFRNSNPVDWSTVVSAFPHLLELNTPWRWRKEGANPSLGEWLADIRSSFEMRTTLDLSDSRISFIKLESPIDWQEPARDACFNAATKGGTVVAICKWPDNSQVLARMTGGLFQRVEALDAKDAAAMLRQLEGTSGERRVNVLLDFLSTIAIHVSEHVKEIRAALFNGGQSGKHLANCLPLMHEVCASDQAANLAIALDALTTLPSVKVFRRELLWAVLDTLRDIDQSPIRNSTEALRRRRNLTSHVGRRLSRCTVGSTLLVKGMEFDHAIVVHTGGARGFSAYDLYVALTRGSRSLTILAPSNTIELSELPDS